LSYYGSGLDLGLAPSKEESCLDYEQLMDEAYEEILPKADGYCKLDMSQPVEDITRSIRARLRDRFSIGKFLGKD
jgi:hypothetical protein